MYLIAFGLPVLAGFLAAMVFLRLSGKKRSICDGMRYPASCPLCADIDDTGIYDCCDCPRESTCCLCHCNKERFFAVCGNPPLLKRFWLFWGYVKIRFSLFRERLKIGWLSLGSGR